MVSKSLGARQGLGGYGFDGAVPGIVIFTAYTSIKSIEQSQARLYEKEFTNATDLLEDLRYQNAIRAAQLDMLILTNRSEQETWHQEMPPTISTRSGRNLNS